MKVIAFTCLAMSVILLLGSLSAADWVQSDGWREGLFVQCVKSGAPTPLPFESDPTPGCKRAHSAGYVRGAAALGIICFITDFFCHPLDRTWTSEYRSQQEVQVLQGGYLCSCCCSDCFVLGLCYLPHLT